MVLGGQHDRITRLLPFVEPMLDMDQAGSRASMSRILSKNGLPNLASGNNLSSLE